MFDRLMFIADFAATHSAAVDRDLAELGADLSAAELEAFCLAETQDLVSFGQPSFSRYLPAGRRYHELGPSMQSFIDLTIRQSKAQNARAAYALARRGTQVGRQQRASVSLFYLSRLAAQAILHGALGLHSVAAADSLPGRHGAGGGATEAVDAEGGVGDQGGCRYIFQAMLQAMQRMRDTAKDSANTMPGGTGRPEPFRICATCGERRLEMQRCSGCKVVHYCSAACQKRDWREHKAACRAALPGGGEAKPGVSSAP